MSHGLTEGCHTHRAHKFTCRFFQSHRLFAKVRVNTLASSPEDWYPLRARAQFHQVFLVLGYLCNPLRIILWYTSGYFPCYAIPKRRRPRWRHFAVLLTSEAHKRSEQTRSSSYLHTNSPDTCTVKNACGFTACYPENLLRYLAHAHAVDTRPSFLRGIRVGWGGGVYAHAQNGYALHFSCATGIFRTAHPRAVSCLSLRGWEWKGRFLFSALLFR